MRPRYRRRPSAAPEASFRRIALLDAAHDAYADWLEESSCVTRLYLRWAEVTRDERALAFAAYAAALEREECAAQVYADMVGMAAASDR